MKLSEISGSHEVKYGDDCPRGCWVIEVVRRFKGACCLDGDRSDDGDSKILWTVGQFLRNCMAYCPRRHLSSGPFIVETRINFHTPLSYYEPWRCNSVSTGLTSLIMEENSVHTFKRTHRISFRKYISDWSLRNQTRKYILCADIVS